MIDHDKNVGTVLKALDDLGIADNTFVMYSTDNGPHMNSWPDGAMTPFRSEKNTNWEGAYRVPAMFRWLLDHAFLLVPAQDYVGQFLSTFKDFPQRQKAASFNMDEVLAKLKEAGGD